jgi:hypothetical protein
VCKFKFLSHILFSTSISLFTDQVAALDAAGLAEALSSEGTYTTFAPSNTAFAKLPTELVDKLMESIWKPQLRDVGIAMIMHSYTSFSASMHLTCTALSPLF